MRICIYFKDLNNTTLKDEYPMQIVEMLINEVERNEMWSLLDGYFGHKQIFIAENDISEIAFYARDIRNI